MSRRRAAVKRKVMPDTRFGSETLSKMINRVMRHGKKATAESIVYGALDIISQRDEAANPLDVFTKALENVAPLAEVRSRRIGGSNYQIPTPVRESRREALAMRWILQAAEARRDLTMKHKLAYELLDASSERGAAYRKKEEAHRMAEANRAYSHFRY